jgi:hypothetical protein
MATKTKAEVNGHTNRLPAAQLAPTTGASKKKGAKDGPIILQRIPQAILKVRIRGTTPLVMCAMSAKTIGILVDNGHGQVKVKEGHGSPEEQFNDARHISADGKWDGIHAVGIKHAIREAARMYAGISMVAVKQAIFIVEDGRSKMDIPLVRIEGKAESYFAMCRTSGMDPKPLPRYRPKYDPWSATITMRVNLAMITEESAVNLLAAAGQFCGVGDVRPTGGGGDWGLFEVIGK